MILIGVLLLDHFLSSLQEPDGEEGALSQAGGLWREGTHRYKRTPGMPLGFCSFALALVWLLPILSSYEESNVPALG